MSPRDRAAAAAAHRAFYNGPVSTESLQVAAWRARVVAEMKREPARYERESARLREQCMSSSARSWREWMEGTWETNFARWDVYWDIMNESDDVDVEVRSLPPLVRDLVLLLLEHVQQERDGEKEAPEPHEQQEQQRRQQPQQQHDERNTPRAYARFIECFVGDYMVWQCERFGLEAVLTSMESVQGAAWTRYVRTHRLWQVRSREHPLMLAWHAVRQLMEFAMDKVWPACSKPRTSQLKEEEEKGAARHQPFVVMMKRAERLRYVWQKKNKEDVYECVQDVTCSLVFRPHSFAEWRQKQRRGGGERM